MRKIKTWSQSVKVILVLVPAPCWPGWGWRQHCCAWASTFSQMVAAAPLLVKRLLVTLKIIWRSRVCILYKAVSHLHTFQNVLLQIIRNQSPWPVKLVRRLGVFSEDSSLAHPPIPVILLSHDCDIEQPLQFLRTQLFFFRVPLRSDKLISTFSRVCPWFCLFVSNGLASKSKNKVAFTLFSLPFPDLLYL